jgi:hypothetical protein
MAIIILAKGQSGDVKLYELLNNLDGAKCGVQIAAPGGKIV